MYRVTVTTRVLNDKDTLRLSAPILVWLVLFIIIFGVMCIADIWFLVLPMFLEFLCIIPVTVWKASAGVFCKDRCYAHCKRRNDL